MRDTGLALHVGGEPLAVLARAGNHLVLLGDPLRPAPDLLPRLQTAAQERSLAPFLYKVGTRIAGQARAAGWTVQEIAAEAWLDPRIFNEDGPDCRQLRRKLRKAAGAGIVAMPVQGALPLGHLVRVNEAWTRSHGGERGFSMGRFPGTSMIHGRTFRAWQEDRIVAFMSFHASVDEWTLDIMRHFDDVPDGTMQALVRAAIAAAASSRRAWFSAWIRA
jgi:phosphatidylglycerol lysyltransferase